MKKNGEKLRKKIINTCVNNTCVNPIAIEFVYTNWSKDYIRFLRNEIVVVVAGNWKGGEYNASEKPKHLSSCKKRRINIIIDKYVDHQKYLKQTSSQFNTHSK